MMKKFRNLKILLIFTAFFSILTLNSLVLGANNFQKCEYSTNIAQKSHSLDDSIILYQINSSSDWEIIPGILGDGTENNPYIIKDVDHREDLAFLSARNSDAYVIIENCRFDAWRIHGYNDLKFFGCTNMEIINCKFYSGYESIYISKSSQFSITNSIFKTDRNQIRIFNCNNFEISTNLFEHSMKAVYLKNCTDGHIFSNNMTGDKSYGFGSGVSISGTSQNLTINDNEIQYVYFAGILIEEGSKFITISNNTIFNDKEQISIANRSQYFNSSIGIAEYGAKNCVIENNHIYNLGKDGILLQECENITVNQNILNNNSQNGISIINASIININNNTIVNNSNYGLYSYNTSHLNLEANIIINNQNEDIKIIKIPFYKQYWFIIITALGLVGIEFFILIRKNSLKKSEQKDNLHLGKNDELYHNEIKLKKDEAIKFQHGRS